MNPSDGWSNSRDACQPNSPSRVGNPYIIFGCLAVEYVEFLRCWCLLDFDLAANAGNKRNVNKYISRLTRKRKEIEVYAECFVIA